MGCRVVGVTGPPPAGIPTTHDHPHVLRDPPGAAGNGVAVKAWVRRVFVAVTLVAIGLVASFGWWSGPLATLLVQSALPRQHGDLHLSGYRRGGPAPQTTEGIRFLLPREDALAWYGAAVGLVLPAAAAEPGSVLWGEVRDAVVPSPLPAQAVSAEPGTAPRLDLRLEAKRVNAWLVAAAERDGSAWVARLDAGSRIVEAELPPSPGWDLALRVGLSGIAARRDGQPGLVRVEAFTGRIEMRWSPGISDTRVEARVRIERLDLRDLRSGFAVAVPAFLLDLVAEAITKALRDQPPVLPFVVPRDARLSVEVIPSPDADRPAF